MFSGKVISIFISKAQGIPCFALQTVEAIAQQGLAGDRYCDKVQNNYGNNNAITLQSIEAIAECNQELDSTFLPEDFRRNIITAGIDLNSLVGKKFFINDVLVEGYELCQPCKYLSNLLQVDVSHGLNDRGGLRARILNSGAISVGDLIKPFVEDIVK